MAMTTAERQEKFREKQIAAGREKVQFWADPEEIRVIRDALVEARKKLKGKLSRRWLHAFFMGRRKNQADAAALAEQINLTDQVLKKLATR